LAVNVLAQRERNFGVFFRCFPIRRLKKLTQFHRDLASISQLDSNSVFARNRGENVDPFRARCPCEIALEAHDFVHPDAFSRIDLIARYVRTLWRASRSEREW